MSAKTWKVKNVPNDLGDLAMVLSRLNVKRPSDFLIFMVKCENREMNGELSIVKYRGARILLP